MQATQKRSNRPTKEVIRDIKNNKNVGESEIPAEILKEKETNYRKERLVLTVSKKKKCWSNSLI